MSEMYRDVVGIGENSESCTTFFNISRTCIRFSRVSRVWRWFGRMLLVFCKLVSVEFQSAWC